MLPVLHLGLVFFPQVAVALRLGRVELREVTVASQDEIHGWQLNVENLPLVVIEASRVHVDNVCSNRIAVGRS